MDIVIKRKHVSVPVLPILAGIILLILLLTTMRIAKVQAEQIGVFVNNLTGSVTVKAQTGSSFYNGLITDFYTLQKTEQIINMSGNDSVRVKTKDGSDVRLDVQINYVLKTDEKLIAKAVIPETGLAKIAVKRVSRSSPREPVDAYNVIWIREYSRSIIRHVFGELTTSEFYNKSDLREQKARQAERELNANLLAHGIEVMRVVTGGFRFYDDYEQKIMAKKAADQEVKSQEKLAEAATQAQEKETITATAVTNVEIARMEGTLRRELLDAEAEAAKVKLGAEAYEYATKTDAEAKFTRIKNEAKANLAIAQAEAEGIRKLAESLVGEGGSNLVKLEFAKVLKKARITGVPYATDPRIQKVEIDAKNTGLNTGGNKGGKR